MKKIAETDAIFENVFAANLAADQNPNILRLSMDSKGAHLTVGGVELED